MTSAPLQPVRHGPPGCSAASLGCQSPSLPTARRHTQPADWAESKIWADWSGTEEKLLKGPFFTSSALALSPLPHPFPLHISAQAIVLCFAPLCSFASSVFSASREFLWPSGKLPSAPLPSAHSHPSSPPLTFFALPWRPARCVRPGWAASSRVTHIFGADCALAIAIHRDACIWWASCAEPSDVVTWHGRTQRASEHDCLLLLLQLLLHQLRAAVVVFAVDALLLPTPGCCCSSATLLSPRATPVHVTALSDRRALLTAVADLNRASTSRPLFHPPVFVRPFLDRESEFSLSTPFLSPTFAVLESVTICVPSRRLIATRPRVKERTTGP